MTTTDDATLRRRLNILRAKARFTEQQRAGSVSTPARPVSESLLEQVKRRLKRLPDSEQRTALDALRSAKPGAVVRAGHHEITVTAGGGLSIRSNRPSVEIAASPAFLKSRSAAGNGVEVA